MADNKATALKDAKNQYQLKVYYEGHYDEALGLEMMGPSVEYGEILDKNKTPWLIKWQRQDGACIQFADTTRLYKKISQDFSDILDSVIVNAKQREAVGKIVNNMLEGYLWSDMAHDGSQVIVPEGLWS